MFRHFPRLTTVFLSYLAVALFLSFLGPEFFEELILPFGALGIFIAGMLYTYSFTASIGALMFLAIAHDYSPGILAVVGGLGSLTSDMVILKFIKNDLKKEVNKLGHLKIVKMLGATPVLKERWFRDVLGAVVIASPLPDEIGVAILASTKIKEDAFIYLALIADMVGIYLLVTAAQLVF